VQVDGARRTASLIAGMIRDPGAIPNAAEILYRGSAAL
jgi:hypothetical protein